MFCNDAIGIVEAHQYDGTSESAATIATAFGLTIVQQAPPAVVFTVPDHLEFSPGDYYNASTREIALPAHAWTWVNHQQRATLGCEWDEYFRDHFIPTDGPAESAALLTPGQ